MASTTPFLPSYSQQHAALDPVYVKALRLLFSKKNESADELRDMLDEAIESSASHNDDSNVPTKKPKLKDIKTERETIEGSKKPLSMPERKRPLISNPTAKTKVEMSGGGSGGGGLIPSKKARLSPATSAGRSTPTSTESSPLGSSLGRTDADDFAMELGLACVLCHQLDVAPGNQLIECQECHNLYHQNCHKPQIADIDGNDPRSVWYCTSCNKNLKKQQQVSSTVPKKVMTKNKPSSQATLRDPSSKKLIEDRKSITPPLMPFKRTEAKANAPSSLAGGVGGSKLTGLASLAANYKPGGGGGSKAGSSSGNDGSGGGGGGGGTSSSRSSVGMVSKLGGQSQMPRLGQTSAGSSSQTSSKSTNRSSLQTTSTANAMKRLHMMKKKAASKR